MYDKKYKYILGVDPGTGSSSPAGFALLKVFKDKEPQIMWTSSLWSSNRKEKDPLVRIREIVNSFSDSFEENKYKPLLIGIENFVMRGAGGVTLMQFRGGIICSFSLECDIINIHNTQMKRLAGGSGKAEKRDIGETLKVKLPTSSDLIQGLMDLRLWDEIDALGIAYSAYMEVFKSEQ